MVQKALFFHISSQENEEDEKLTRRPRTSITLCQRERLEEEFLKERYPTLAYIDKLSRRVHLPQYVIKVMHWPTTLSDKISADKISAYKNFGGLIFRRTKCFVG